MATETRTDEMRKLVHEQFGGIPHVEGRTPQEKTALTAYVHPTDNVPLVEFAVENGWVPIESDYIEADEEVRVTMQKQSVWVN